MSTERTLRFMRALSELERPLRRKPSLAERIAPYTLLNEKPVPKPPEICRHCGGPIKYEYGSAGYGPRCWCIPV